MYKDMALVYDELMDDVDYEGWFNYIEEIFNRFEKKPIPYWKWLVALEIYLVIWQEKVMI